MEKFLSLEKPAFGEYSEKRSRFLARIFPCAEEEEAQKQISEIKSEFFDAKHVVFAYSLVSGKFKYSDDGEPHSTAGKPIFDILEGKNLKNINAIVVRYFGGVLLGPGGLMRAYGQAVKNALENAQLKEFKKMAVFNLECGYPEFSEVKKLIADNDGKIINSKYSQVINTEFYLPDFNSLIFEDKLKEKFNSKISAQKQGEKYFSE